MSEMIEKAKAVKSTTAAKADGDLKADQGKTRYDLLPVDAIEGIANIFTYGSYKYDDYNWLKSVHPERYYAAGQRHLAEVRRGNWIDPESGLPHIDHANTCFVMYRELLIKLGANGKS